MSDPDAVPNELLDAARILGNEAHKMLLVAWTKGFRDGLEAGAKISDEIGRLVDKYGGCDFVPGLISQELRLSSLGMKEPTLDSGS